MFNPFQLIQLFQQFRTNPMQMLMRGGYNIPQQYMQSPETAARYLMQNSNMTQDQMNELMQNANQLQQTFNQNGFRF